MEQRGQTGHKSHTSLKDLTGNREGRVASRGLRESCGAAADSEVQVPGADSS